MNLFKQGIKQDATDSATLGINARSFEVSNMSQYDLQINDPILNGYRLPAYASKTFEATPGMTIDFRLVAPVVNTNGTTSTQYVQIAESPVALVTPVTPLALIPIYNLPITGNVTADISNANVPISGNVNAMIQNASVPVSGSVAISSGSIDATISQSNITLDTNMVNALISTNGVILSNAFQYTIPALNAGETWGGNNDASLWGALNFPSGWYTDLAIIVNPANANWLQVNVAPNINTAGTIISTNGGTSYNQQSNFDVTPIHIGLNLFNRSDLAFKNTGTTTSASLTVTVQIALLPASVQIDNPSTSPVHTQSVNGSPTASNVVNTTGGATTPLISSGGVIKKIYIGACASGGAFPNPCTLHVINGTANVAEFDVSGMVQYQWKTFELDFGDGIANSGISVYYGAVGTPPNGQATGYAIMQ